MKYLLNRIARMNFKKMFEIVNKIYKKTNRNRLLLFLDIVYCGLKYQSGYMDYYLLEFYNLKNKDRKTYITRGINNRYIRHFNDRNYYHFFSNKDEFNNRFKKYLKREFIFINNNEKEFNEFIKNKEYIFCKPRNGSCGKEIEKIKVSDYKDKNLYEYLRLKNLIVVEELIKQDAEMNKLYPYSVNTIRIVSILHNNKVNIVFAYLRIGSSKNFVDNFNSGGMVVPVNINTGEIEFPAIEKDGNLYEKHPDTKVSIKGFTIPRFEEAKELVQAAGKEIKEIGMAGWDIAISDKGPLIVEANELPGHDIYQLPPHRKTNKGLLEEYHKIIKL